MIFSHGLGGSRNTYSHLAGSMASYGVVVVCPEHRDGSGALSLIRDPAGQNHNNKSTRNTVPYIRIPHTQTHETWEARNKQLRIRLWELGLIFEALCAIDRGDNPTVTSNLNTSTPHAALTQFTNTLDILNPGKVIFAGHSFGAVTAVQLLKSTFYANHPTIQNMTAPLFTPTKTSAIAAQITAANPTILLDMWCFPLLATSTAPLYNLPLPCYSAGGPGGSAILAIESEAFYKWTEHLHAKARVLCPDPTAERGVTAALFRRRRHRRRSADGLGSEPETNTDAEMETETETYTETEKADAALRRPHFFYVASSAHLNQSDFGVLFPWLTKRVFKSDRPERVLRLNVRAQLQFLRENGVSVAGTAREDLVDGGCPSSDVAGERVDEDAVILQPPGGGGGKGRPVEAWEWIDVVGLGGETYPSELDMQRGGREEQEAKAEEGEKEMQGEIEPSLANGAVEGQERALKEAVGETK